MLKDKWKIYERPIKFQVQTVEKICLATLCLHNFLITHELNVDEANRRYVVEGQQNFIDEPYVEHDDENIAGIVPNNEALHIRQTLSRYFVEEGEVEFQYERV